MNGGNSNIQIENSDNIDEKILINDFRDSEALKEQIRKTTDCYSRKGWSLIKISSEGRFIFLKFKSPK